MNSDPLHEWGPLLLAALSLGVSALGLKLRRQESKSAVETDHVEQIVSINGELRAELARKNQLIDELQETNRDLEQDNHSKTDQLVETLVKLHSLGSVDAKTSSSDKP